MGLSNPKDNSLYDLVRKKWVKTTPEEVIRQRLLEEMIYRLGYPLPLIAVEKELAQLITGSLKAGVPKRRADIVVFYKGSTTRSLKPLLLIECKAVPLTPQFANQVIGYNSFLGAPFISLANEEQILTGHWAAEKGGYHFAQGLPHFDQINLEALTR